MHFPFEWRACDRDIRCGVNEKYVLRMASIRYAAQD